MTPSITLSTVGKQPPLHNPAGSYTAATPAAFLPWHAHLAQPTAPLPLPISHGSDTFERRPLATAAGAIPRFGSQGEDADTDTAEAPELLGASNTTGPAKPGGNGRLTPHALDEVPIRTTGPSRLMTFADWEARVAEKPHIMLRTAPMMAAHALEAGGSRIKNIYGRDVTVYDVLLRAGDSSEILRGQEWPAHRVARKLRALGLSRFAHQLLCVQGAPGSGKSLLLKNLEQGIVAYLTNQSDHPDGVMYRIVWAVDPNKLPGAGSSSTSAPSRNGDGHQNDHQDGHQDGPTKTA
ncbi:MAG: hypothetical protein KC476_04010 [Cyanobacteria bacterium HKST-UBA06]|nr:hypothetical protein [Cyanobacteria bacterium HKST-UBA06]